MDTDYQTDFDEELNINEEHAGLFTIGDILSNGFASNSKNELGYGDDVSGDGGEVEDTSKKK